MVHKAPIPLRKAEPAREADRLPLMQMQVLQAEIQTAKDPLLLQTAAPAQERPEDKKDKTVKAQAQTTGSLPQHADNMTAA